MHRRTTLLVTAGIFVCLGVLTVLGIGLSYVYEEYRLRSQIDTILVDDARITASVLKLDFASSGPVASEMSKACDKCIQERSRLIADLNALGDTKHQGTIDSLRNFLAEENFMVLQKQHLYDAQVAFNAKLDEVKSTNWYASSSSDLTNKLLAYVDTKIAMEDLTDRLEGEANSFEAAYVHVTGLESDLAATLKRDGFNCYSNLASTKATNDSLASGVRQLASEARSILKKPLLR